MVRLLAQDTSARTFWEAPTGARSVGAVQRLDQRRSIRRPRLSGFVGLLGL